MNPNPLVCIVDDDASVRDSLSLLLGLQGYDCRSFASGADFLSTPPLRPCCVILDLNMGDMDGVFVQEKLKDLRWPVQIIFLTAFANVSVMRQAFLNAAVDFLEKPVNPEQLLAALKQAVDRLKLSEQDLSSDKLQDALTPREREVLEVIAEGLTHRQIGEKLGISPRTVEVHKGRIMEKLGVGSLAELIKVSLNMRKG
jgi:RNA polymerase sigma factor (sigma-70 family)